MSAAAERPPRGERLPLWLDLALREIRNSRVFSLAFALSLSLGLSGFLTLDAFMRAITAHLGERSRAMLGADLEISGDRPLTDAEQAALAAALPPGSRVRHEISMLSMLAKGDLSRLVEVRAVDDAYPFYGAVGLRLAGAAAEGAASQLTGPVPRLWVYPELLAQLDARVGDTLRLGNASFAIADVVDKDPGAAAAGLGYAPKAFIGAPHLASTALISKGSRVFHTTLVKLASGPGVDADAADAVVATVRAALPDASLRVKSHKTVSEELYRVQLHLTDYLGLVSLVALFLAGVGGAYLFRSFLERRGKDIAVLLSLGLDARLVRRVYVTQLALLGTAGAAATALFAWVLVPLLPWALGTLMPADVTPRLTLPGLLLVLAMGVGGSILACLPLLMRVGAVRPAALFQEETRVGLELRARHALWWLPALVAFWGLAVAASRSLRTGSLFLGVFLASVGVLAVAALGLMRGAQRLAARPGLPLPLSLAALSLARHRTATLASFVALSLGALLVTLIPELRAVLETELTRPAGGATPSLFLFDIQEEQVAPLKTALAGLGARLAYPSPMVRARLTAVNGVAADVALPGKAGQAEERRELNRGYNLSYRDELAPSEELVAGRAFSGRYEADPARPDTPCELSLEARFAERHGLGLGDRLAFDVQGVPVQGVVVSLRRVRWTSFQPNFFVELQPGVLDEAPKTYVAAVPALTSAGKLNVQQALVRGFPNVSVIDVTATIARLVEIVDQMERALTFMALLALAAGLAVLYAIARYQAIRRLPDVTLLKVLGAGFGQLRTMALLEFGLLGAAAAGLGALASVGAALVLADLLFDRLWVLDWRTPLAAAAALAAATTLTGFAAVSRSLGASPLRFLNRAGD